MYPVFTSIRFRSIGFVFYLGRILYYTNSCFPYFFASVMSPNLATRSHNAEGSSQELKAEVEQHLKEMEIIEQSLPSSLVIGPFLVRVDAVRKSLTKKRKSLATALLEHLVQKLRVQIDKVSLCIFIYFEHKLLSFTCILPFYWLSD